MAKTYDPKCYDTSRMTAKQIGARTASLACEIQQAIENWTEDANREAVEAEAHADEMLSLCGYTDEERAAI